MEKEQINEFPGSLKKEAKAAKKDIVQGSDTTGDAQVTNAGNIKKQAQKPAFNFYSGKPYTANEVPQPQVLLALGLLKVKPRLFNPP